MVSIEVVSFLVREVVSIALGIVVEIIVDTTSDKVGFLVREVVSIALGIVVGIIVDTSFSSLPEPSDLSTQIKPVFSVRVAKS